MFVSHEVPRIGVWVSKSIEMSKKEVERVRFFQEFDTKRLFKIKPIETHLRCISQIKEDVPWLASTVKAVTKSGFL